MIFWITAAALAIAVTAIVLTALLRSKDAGEHPAAYDLRVYRDQLKEVERDLARGVISEADAERTRAEVGRRVLSADTQLKAARTGGEAAADDDADARPEIRRVDGQAAHHRGRAPR